MYVLGGVETGASVFAVRPVDSVQFVEMTPAALADELLTLAVQLFNLNFKEWWAKTHSTPAVGVCALFCKHRRLHVIFKKNRCAVQQAKAKHRRICACVDGQCSSGGGNADVSRAS